MILRLVVIGENIFEICLSQCLFEFGFPFGQVALSRKRLKLCRCVQADMAAVKRIPLGEKGEKVVVEVVGLNANRTKCQPDRMPT